ncbi:hypothetical protein, partial [Pseudomonas sp. AU8050]|uniref:hypothetical protein n=1 Tax=Pseudomonas sp. AU8050 TaxID=2681497 RepID=UPI001C49C3CF
RRGSRVRVPSAAPYSVTWNAERQVAKESPLIERAFFCPKYGKKSCAKLFLNKLHLNQDITIFWCMMRPHRNEG